VSKIFISYRRQDSDAYAGRLWDRLAPHFGAEDIFMDIDMNLGVDFVDEIQQKVALCKVLIAVIGRTWLEIKNDAGLRRLDDPEDWVRLEIATALERGIPVIPALVGGAKMPKASDLPSVLSKLTRRQAIDISHAGFKDDTGRLIRGLEAILSPQEKGRAREREEKKTGRSKKAISKPSALIAAGIYLDPETGLMWTVHDNGKAINWLDGKQYAKQLKLGGHSGWRLPKIEELEKLYDAKRRQKRKIRRPFLLTGSWVWSSTASGSGFSCFFDFSRGHRYRYDRNFAVSRALCVR
jgi:hypothetical protein